MRSISVALLTLARLPRYVAVSRLAATDGTFAIASDYSLSSGAVARMNRPAKIVANGSEFDSSERNPGAQSFSWSCHRTSLSVSKNPTPRNPGRTNWTSFWGCTVVRLASSATDNAAHYGVCCNCT